MMVHVMFLSVMSGESFGGMGAFWSNSEVLLDWQGFDEQVNGAFKAMELQSSGEDGGGAHLPQKFWVSDRVYPDGDNVGGFTQGLAMLTGYELEITPIPWERGQVMQRLFGIVAYLFLNGPVLRPGETLGVTETERFHIREEADSESGNQRLILSLETEGTDQ